jgi:hypothetical protein
VVADGAADRRLAADLRGKRPARHRPGHCTNAVRGDRRATPMAVAFAAAPRTPAEGVVRVRRLERML